MDNGILSSWTIAFSSERAKWEAYVSRIFLYFP